MPVCFHAIQLLSTTAVPQYKYGLFHIYFTFSEVIVKLMIMMTNRRNNFQKIVSINYLKKPSSTGCEVNRKNVEASVEAVDLTSIVRRLKSTNRSCKQKDNKRKSKKKEAKKGKKIEDLNRQPKRNLPRRHAL